MNLWTTIVSIFRNWFFFAWLAFSGFVLGCIFLIDWIRGA